MAKKAKQISHKLKKNIEWLNSIDLAKRDEYAVKFNASTDHKEQIEILKKMKPYEVELSKCIKESEKIRKEYNKNEKLYRKIEIERTKENDPQRQNKSRGD